MENLDHIALNINIDFQNLSSMKIRFIAGRAFKARFFSPFLKMVYGQVFWYNKNHNQKK